MASAVPNSFPFARMSLTHKSFRFLFLSLFLSVLFVFPESTLSSSSFSNSIQNLLQSQGLPGGLFPHDVKSFTLHADGLLEVLLDRPCLAKFDTRVYFDSVVRANLTYGKLMGMEGLSQKELFLWLPVKDIMVDDPSSGVIVFDIGVAYKQLSLSLFEDPPVCRPPDLEVLQPNIGRKKIGFEAPR